MSSSLDTMQGAFTASMADLISYRYVGCQAELIDADHSVSTTAVRSHLCTPGSISAPALAISMLDAAGIAVDRVHLLGLTEVDLQLYEPALDVSRLRTFGAVARWARTQVFTECRFEDADRPGRVLGTGAANWSVLAPTPEGFTYTDPGPGYPEGGDTPSMAEAFTVAPGPGGSFVVPELTTRVGAEVLHHGPMLVALEQAALAAAGAAAGTDRLALASWSMRIVRAGKRAPFTATAEVLAASDAVVGCRAELVDGSGVPVALALISYRR
jgi:hypothetical protein